ncbi:MAG TPA: aldo/keto reductase [Coleofasciculaceae cyanobacterium]|jgi:aryl-alcohol dehydrogenase-like predicted oxidoreductase
MTIKGFATSEGTERYRARFEGKSTGGLPIAEGHFRDAVQGLHLTSLGMGTYLGGADDQTSRQMADAAVRSVSSGAINVLDTAVNYRYQLSERSLAAALKMLIGQGFQRDEIFVCSKNGFLTPDAGCPDVDFRTWFREHYIDSGMIAPGEIAGGMHCMAPAYLADQLDRSRANLGLETLDLMYLHNAAESQMPEVGRATFMERLRQAFVFYEQARADGKIRYYGMATWSCFRQDPNDPDSNNEYLSLETVMHLAGQVGGPEHGFRFIQLPFNLAFSEALTLPNQPLDGEMVSLLEAAMALGVGVFTSVPLLQGQLLNQPLPKFEGMKTPAQECLQFVRSNPGVLAPMVGHKKPEHVEENIQVAAVPPLMLAEFEEMLTSS